MEPEENSAAGSSQPSSQTPVRPRLASSAACCSRQSVSGTMRSPSAGSGAGTDSPGNPITCQVSAAMRRRLMSVVIHVSLEGFDADAVHHVHEALVLGLALIEIGADQALDDLRHLAARHGRPDHAAERRARALSAPDADLVPLLA